MKKLLSIIIVLSLVAWLLSFKIMGNSLVEEIGHYQAIANHDVPNPELTKWQKEYPASPNIKIKAGLMKLLNEMKEVDFGAELKDGACNKKVFVNPEYEKKPYIWKMCCRAGSETTHTVQQFFYSGARN